MLFDGRRKYHELKQTPLQEARGLFYRDVRQQKIENMIAKVEKANYHRKYEVERKVRIHKCNCRYP